MKRIQDYTRLSLARRLHLPSFWPASRVADEPSAIRTPLCALLFTFNVAFTPALRAAELVSLIAVFTPTAIAATVVACAAKFSFAFVLPAVVFGADVVWDHASK